MEVPELKYVDFELKDGIGVITMNLSLIHISIHQTPKTVLPDWTTV